MHKHHNLNYQRIKLITIGYEIGRRQSGSGPYWFDDERSGE